VQIFDMFARGSMDRTRVYVSDHRGAMNITERALLAEEKGASGPLPD